MENCSSYHNWFKMITISCSRLLVVGPVEKTTKTIVTGFARNAASDFRVDRLPETKDYYYFTLENFQNWNALYSVLFPTYLEHEAFSPGDMGPKMRVVITSSGSRLPTDAADVGLFSGVYL